MASQTLRERLLDAVLWAIVPVAAYGSHAAAFLLDPFTLRNRARMRLTPELRRFPSATLRARAVVTARGGSIVIEAVLLVAALAASLLVFERCSTVVGSLESGMLRRMSPAAACLTAWWVFWWGDVARIATLRTPTRAALRGQLLALGLPTCVHCGAATGSRDQASCEACAGTAPGVSRRPDGPS